MSHTTPGNGYIGRARHFVDQADEGAALGSALEFSSDIRIVLLDVGNVLASDYWETMLLTPATGLADLLHLDREEVRAVGERVWREFCRAPATEAAYWERVSEELGTSLPAEMLQVLDELPIGNPHAPEILRDLSDRGLRVGILSDNTSFWFPKQAARIGLDGVVDQELCFLSYEQGLSKSDDPGLIHTAARVAPPSRTLVVDDRAHNLEAARSLGFHTLRYALAEDDGVNPQTVIAP